MDRRTAEEVEAFLWRRAPLQMSSGEVEEVPFERQLSLLWPVLQIFGRHREALSAVPYDASFEAEADEVLRDLAASGNEIQLSAEDSTMRVVFERLNQIALVFLANMAAKETGTIFPKGLADDVLRGCLILYWTLRMVLPWAPGRMLPDLPEGLPPMSTTPH